MCCVINSEPAHGTDCSNKLHTRYDFTHTELHTDKLQQRKLGCKQCSIQF